MESFPQHDQALTITRVFDAPRELVFKVWTQPEHFAKWLGPKDFEATIYQMDVRLGGFYRACIRSPEGRDYWMQGIYREIKRPERLIFTFAWEDDDGQPKHKTLVTVAFTQQNNKTLMTFHQAMFESIEERDSHRLGWSECFDRLETYLAKPETGLLL